MESIYILKAASFEEALKKLGAKYNFHGIALSST